MESLTRGLFALLVTCLTVRIIGQGNALLIVKGCLTKESLDNGYGITPFEILSGKANYKPVFKEKENYYIRVSNFVSGDISMPLIKAIEQTEDEDRSKIESEINNLKDITTLTDRKVTPGYQYCIYDVVKDGEKPVVDYYILQETVFEPISFYLMMELFKGLPPFGKAFKFLQIAIAIQTLHAAGFTHQDIRPENIASIDEAMTDLRLIDFGNSAKVGTKVVNNPKVEGKDYFNSPDKFGKEFVATFRQDTFAFAMTMIFLLDVEDIFLNAISYLCPSTMKGFTNDCQTSINKGIDALITKGVIAGLLTYLKEHLFSESSALDISDMISKLADLHDALIPSSEKNLVEKKKAVEDIRKKSEANAKKIAGIQASLQKNEERII